MTRVQAPALRLLGLSVTNQLSIKWAVISHWFTRLGTNLTRMSKKELERTVHRKWNP